MTDIDPIVAAVFDVIAERLKQGDVVQLGCFGSFALAKQVFTRAGSASHDVMARSTRAIRLEISENWPETNGCRYNYALIAPRMPTTCESSDSG